MAIMSTEPRKYLSGSLQQEMLYHTIIIIMFTLSEAMIIVKSSRAMGAG